MCFIIISFFFWKRKHSFEIFISLLSGLTGFAIPWWIAPPFVTIEDAQNAVYFLVQLHVAELHAIEILHQKKKRWMPILPIIEMHFQIWTLLNFLHLILLAEWTRMISATQSLNSHTWALSYNKQIRSFLIMEQCCIIFMRTWIWMKIYCSKS